MSLVWPFISSPRYFISSTIAFNSSGIGVIARLSTCISPSAPRLITMLYFPRRNPCPGSLHELRAAALLSQQRRVTNCFRHGSPYFQYRSLYAKPLLCTRGSHLYLPVPRALVIARSRRAPVAFRSRPARSRRGPASFPEDHIESDMGSRRKGRGRRQRGRYCRGLKLRLVNHHWTVGIGEFGGKAPCALSEYNEIRQRVSPQPIRTVQSAATSGRRARARRTSARIAIYADSSHHVVSCGPDLHRLFRDVQIGQLFELVVHTGEFALNVLG